MLSHRQGWFLALLFLMLSYSVRAGSANDLPAATYRATVSEVRITFFATDEKNRPVDKIGKDDFAVVDNGIVVRDSAVSRDPTRPRLTWWRWSMPANRSGPTSKRR